MDFEYKKKGMIFFLKQNTLKLWNYKKPDKTALEWFNQ